MNLYFMNVIERLEYKSDSIAGLHIRACALRDMTGALLLLKELRQHIVICSENRLKDELPFYYLLFAYCCLFVEECNEAKKYSVMAIENFRVCGMSWNQAIGHWFLGLIYRSEKKGFLYLLELDKALTIISSIAADYLTKGDYKSAAKGNDVKKKLEEQKSCAQKMGAEPLGTPDDRKQEEISIPVTLSSEIDGYLTLPWIPIYEEVQAGTNGPIWAELPKPTKMEVPFVLLQKECYSVHSFRYGEKQITLTSDRQYAWARVRGNSMNIAKPVPIHNGDYVLFYKAHHSEHNGVVIAAIPEKQGTVERAYIVKRFSKDDNLLASETSCKGKEYEPIPLRADFQIIGIVVAVAKPTSQI